MPTVYETVAPLIRGQAWYFYVWLISQSDTDIFQANPTIQAGDFKHITNDSPGVSSNLDTLPSVDGSTYRVRVDVSAEETDFSVFTIEGIDASGNEWQSFALEFRPEQAVTVSDGTGVTLANDAITSAKFDETTAFPLKAADSGSTYIARTGADSDTLETLSDQLDAAEAADIADAVCDEALSGHTTSGTVGASLNRLGTGIISATSIVAADNAVTTYEGDDYNNTDGRALDWTEESGSIWPMDLTGATITITIADYATSFSGSVVTPTGDSQKVRLELTSAQTTLIPPGTKSYMVRATLSATYSNRQATLVRGTWKHYNKIASS